MRIASDFRIPLFTDNPEPSQDGAVACVGVGFYQPGYAIAEMVARVLHGTPPSEIPIENVSEKIEWINRPIAKSLGLTIPENLPDDPKPSNKP